MGSAHMTWLQFADAQESSFQAWARSYMGSVFLLGGRYADVQELRFKLRNVQIYAVPNWKGF